MTKRSLGRAAVRLYPSGVREARGDELVGTLLDAGDASLTAFIAELVSLVFAALKARSRRARAVPVSTLIFELLCWGAVVNVAKVAGHSCVSVHTVGQSGRLDDDSHCFLCPHRTVPGDIHCKAPAPSRAAGPVVGGCRATCQPAPARSRRTVSQGVDRAAAAARWFATDGHRPTSGPDGCQLAVAAPGDDLDGLRADGSR
jgi:hypothetical protein